MDSGDAILCLEDIRQVRFTVNEILRLIKSGGRTGVVPVLPPTPPLSTNSQISGLERKVEKIWRLLTNVTRSIQDTIPTTTSAPTFDEGEEQPLWVDRHQPGSSETLATLLLVSLGAWLAVVILALLWMRLADLHYRPVVVSKENIFFYSFFNCSRDAFIDIMPV